MLNVRVVPNALRKYFDGLIPSARLATTINQNSTIVSYLVNRRVINSAQLDILQRIPGTIWPSGCPSVPIGPNASSSADFDVTLMVCLLRNIPLPGIYQPASGWDNLPIPNDTSPGAYLSRIKYYRNEIAHSTENKLNTLDFHDKWKTISEAITFCNGGHSPNAIMEILHCDLDGSQSGIIVTCLMTEIEAVKRDLILVEGDLQRTELQLENVQSDFHFYKDGHLPKNISDNIHELINKWRIDDKPFFFTRAGKLVYDMLESENIVMIIGQSGSGKSATARNIALKCIANGYDVVPVESVEQILEYRCKGTKQIFVIDDAVGKYSVNGSHVNQWERLDSKLTTLFIDDNAKLICTLRKVVAIDTKFKCAKIILSNKAFIIDLDHADNCLLREEKMSILKNHLIFTDRQNDISDDECKDCCNGNFAFPLLCQAFTTSDGLFLRKSDFFQKPFNYLNDEITKLHERNKEVYCSLVICMIFSGKVGLNLFSVSSGDSNEEQEKEEHIIDMIAEACGLNRNISKQTLLDSLLSVEGVYVKSYFENTYFLHDTFLEAVSFHFSKVSPSVFLECCDIKFLRERVRVISPQRNDDENIIVLKKKSFCFLANRFIRELKQGEFIDILCSQPIKDETFIRVMGNVLDCGQLITRKKLMETEISFVAYLKWTRLYSVLRQENNIEAVVAIMEIFSNASTLLHWTVATGNIHLMDCFFRQMSQKQQNRYIRLDKSIFSLALLSGCKEIIKTMFEEGADVESLESQYALKKIVINSRDSQLLEFFMNNGIGVNFIDSERKTLLFHAITSKNFAILEFLVEKDSRQNTLHEAVYNSNIKKLKNYLSCQNINIDSANGWSVFHFAAYNNDIAVMEIIFEAAMKNKLFSLIDKRDKLGWSPLHLASILSNYEAVDILMSKGANANLVDLDGKTPVSFSCNEQITGSLLKYDRCLIELTTENERSSTEVRQQQTEDKTKDTKAIAKRIKAVRMKGANTRFFSKEFIIECSIEYKKDKDNKWTPHIDNSPVHANIMNEIPENMKNWHPSLLSLIYVTYMNILFLNFSIGKFRRKIDKPDKEGNTILHAAAGIENQEDSISSVKMILERGANPLFYNKNGCLPSDVAFYKRSYKVKLFLDIYALHAAKRGLGILIFIIIISFFLVIFLSSSAYFICCCYPNGDVNTILNNSSVSKLPNYSNSALNNDIDISIDQNNISILFGNRTDNNQHMFKQAFRVIHLHCIICILFLNLLWAFCKKLVWPQKHFLLEDLNYVYVHSIAIFRLTSICFSNDTKFVILHRLIYDFLLMNLLSLFIDICIRLKKSYYPEWFTFCTVPFSFILCFSVIILSVIFLNSFIEIVSVISFIRSFFVSLSSWSIILLFLSSVLTCFAFYIYINVIPCCAYLLLLKIWGISKFFRQLIYTFQFGIFRLGFQSPINTNPCVGNPSFIWGYFFQSTLIFILLIYGAIMFSSSYQQHEQCCC